MFIVLTPSGTNYLVWTKQKFEPIVNQNIYYPAISMVYYNIEKFNYEHLHTILVMIFMSLYFK